MFPRFQTIVLCCGIALGSLLGGCEGELHVEVGDPIDTGTDTGDLIDTEDVDADIFPGSENLYNQRCPDYYELVPVPLGEIAGGDFSGLLRAINNKGWVVGEAYGDAVSGGQPYVWKLDEDNGKTGEMFPLPDAIVDGQPFSPTYLRGINDNGQVIGEANYEYNDGWEIGDTTFVWSEADGYIRVDEGWDMSAINNDGMAVGETRDAGFYWTAESGFVEMPVVSEISGTTSTTADVNDAGVVAGSLRDGAGRQHAVKFTVAGGYSKQPDFEADHWEGGTSHGINNRGQIVGSAKKYSPGWGFSLRHPVLWEANGTFHDLGILGNISNLDQGGATDINDDGIVVGHDTQPKGRSYAWVWCGDAKRALDDMLAEDTPPGWEIRFVVGINDDGLIAVNGALPHTDGQQSAVLHPVFEIQDAK